MHSIEKSDRNTGAWIPGEDDQRPISLHTYAAMLWQHRWMIAVAACAGACLAYGASCLLPPVYESTAKLEINRRAPVGIIGADSNLPAGGSDIDPFITTQMELIQSDAVLRPVVEKYNLLSTERQLEGESARQQQVVNAPILLRGLEVSRPPNTFLIHISYKSPDARLSAGVANATANSYLDYISLTRIQTSAGSSGFMEKQLSELRERMANSGTALSALERELNLVNPTDNTNITSARLLQLNTEYTNAQAARVQKETAYASIRSGGAAAAQASTQGDSLNRLKERVNAAREHMSEVKVVFGVNHSEYRKAASQLAELENQVAETQDSIGQRVEVEYKQALEREQMLAQAVASAKAESNRLNARWFDYQRLKQEAESDRKLYDELERKTQEAAINAGFQNGTFRLADLARPAAKPISPRPRLNAFVGFLLAAGAIMVIVIVRELSKDAIRCADDVPWNLRARVLASLPVVKLVHPATEAALIPGRTNARQLTPPISDTYGEAIRTLRNALVPPIAAGRFKSFLVTSAVAGEGKSMTALNLAIAFARQGQKTVLVDADLRRPTPGASNSAGLAQALGGVVPVQEVVTPVENEPNLFMVPAGLTTSRASDLIGPATAEVMAELSLRFDTVIIDGPPVFGCAETLQIATAADGVILVARAGGANRGVVASAVQSLTQVCASVCGIVVNSVDMKYLSQYGHTREAKSVPRKPALRIRYFSSQEGYKRAAKSVAARGGTC